MNTPALRLDYFDQSVRPQDDLFRHVNGTWLKNAAIPEDKSSWGVFNELRDASQAAVREIVESLDDQDPSSVAGKISALYASFMAEEHIEQLDDAPLHHLLKMVDAIKDPAGMARYLGWAVRHGVTSLYQFQIDADPGDPTRYVLFVGQSGLGLPDEVYYREPIHAETLKQYQTHIAQMLSLAGYSDSLAQAEVVVELEHKIAAHHWDNVRTRDLTQMYNLMTWQDFTAQTSPLQWESFMAGGELQQNSLSEIVNCQPSFFTGVAGLVETESFEHWRCWARWHLISAIAPLLSKRFVRENFDFYSHKLAGTPQLRPRWKRGVSLVESVLGEGIGECYVARYFPPTAKTKMDELVTNLIEAYRRSISALDWMGEATKAEALAKLANLRPKIGYPNKWRDYCALIISADDLVGNMLRASSFNLDYNLAKLNHPVDPDEWLMFPQTVNAYYHPLRNEIVFPAGILQPPFFNVEADDAVNYGAIGAIIGHEIGHGFDDQGSTTDSEGRLRNWWTPNDRDAFVARTNRLVDQYQKLSLADLPNQTVNGELTLGENIGDLGGIGIAYQAWLLAGGQPDGTPIDGYTPAQRLFLGWAASWRAKLRPALQQQRLATDPHSPPEFRCNQTVRNLSSFAAVFELTPSDKLWLAPDQRVKIW